MIRRGVVAALVTGAWLSAALGMGCASGVVTTPGQPALGRWEPMIAVKDFHSLTADSGGVIWVQHDQDLAWLDKGQARTPAGPRLATIYYLTTFFGGPDRGAYLAQGGPEQHQGMLYRLADGRATYLTDFYYDVAYEKPCLYISKTGRIFSWGREFLAEYADGKWVRIDARLGLYPCILDVGDTVWFYCNQKLCRADAGGRLSVRDIEVPIKATPGQRWVHGALLGRDTMLLVDYESKSIYACKLETGERVLEARLGAAFAGLDASFCFGAADGSAWVLAQDKASDTHRFDRQIFYRVTPGGDVRPMFETAALKWFDTRSLGYPSSILLASDGSTWLGGPDGDVARWKDGRLRIFDWRDGLDLAAADFISEMPDGRIIAAPRGVLSGGGSAYVFRPDVPSPPPPADLALWTDYRADRHGIIRDGKDGLWMFLADRPGEASRWDGAAWRHVKVPFDTAKVGRCMGDDRGHLVVQAEGEAPGAYDVSVGGVARYADLRALLVAAVEAGVRRFEPSPDFAGCMVLDGGRIWFGYAGDTTLFHYDGRKWIGVPQEVKIRSVVESPKYGMLATDDAYRPRFYTYHERQMTPIATVMQKGDRGLIGPWGLQPFEEELLDRYPGLYEAVECAGRYQWCALTRTREQGEVHYSRGDEPEALAVRLIPAQAGGFWTSGNTWPFRELDGKEFHFDMGRTPFRGQDICQVMDDPAHNVWFATYESSAARHVWVKRLDRLRLKVADTPARCGRELKVKAKPEPPRLGAGGLRLFWRVDGGLWISGDSGGEATVCFPSSGPHEFQILGMDPTGGTMPRIVTRRVTATVALPRIVARMPGPMTVEDIIWTPPVWAKPSDSKELARVVYRTGDGEWEDASSGRISMAPFKPGTYEIEFTAQEYPMFRDPTPVRLKVTYAPDARCIVEKRMAALAGEDTQRSWAVRKELLEAGPLIVPVIREKLREGPENPRVREAFEEILKKYGAASPDGQGGGK